MLTQDHINELIEIIESNHLLFLGQNIGIDILSKNDEELLSKYIGVDWKKLIKENNLLDAFQLGIVSESLEKEAMNLMDFNRFKRFIQSSEYIPLTTQEKRIFRSIQQQSYKDIKGQASLNLYQ